MRWSTLRSVLAMLLCAGSAGAASGHGGSGSKGGGTSAGSASSSGGESVGGHPMPGGGHGESPFSETYSDAEFEPANLPHEYKWWQVEGVFETHRLLRQGDLQGDAPDKVFNFYYLYLNFDPSPEDRITLRGGAYQRFIADQQEHGLRLDDTVLKYERFVRLPENLLFRPSFRVTAPTAFDSQKQSLITAPRLQFELSAIVGDFEFDAIEFQEYYWMKYSTAEGGNVNPKWRLSGTLAAEYHLPIYRPLSFGAAVTDEYYWYYQNPASGPAASQNFGAVSDPYYTGQPIQQTYGYQIFGRYQIPSLEGLNGDFVLAYGQGDPTLGYTSRLHDGAAHSYLFYRRTSEVYASLTLRY